MAFSTCCLVLSGVALADDLGMVVADSVAGDNSPLIMFSALDNEGNPVSLSAGEQVSITTNQPIDYGVSGSEYHTIMPQTFTVNKRSDGKYYLDSYSLAGTTGLFYRWPAGLNVDYTWSVNASYPDVSSIEFWGDISSDISVYDNKGNAMYIKPTSYSLLINGRVVSSVNPTLDYTYNLSKGESVTSVGIRYTFGENFDLMATADNSTVRGLRIKVGFPTENANETTSGWFSRLFEWLSNILDGINGLWDSITSGFSNVVNSITSLPAKIGEAIKGLFVPSDSQMDELKASFNTLLSEKLGFVYQAGSLVTGVFEAVFDAVDNPASDVSFSVPAFPAFNVGGTDVSLWDDSIVVNIAENQVVQTVQQVSSPFVIAVMVWGFVHSMEDAFLAFVGGKTLSDWVRERKGEKE